MDAEEKATITKEVNKLKFKASQRASELHDLIEERLLIDFEDIPAFAEATYLACKAWKEKEQTLRQVQDV